MASLIGKLEALIFPSLVETAAAPPASPAGEACAWRRLCEGLGATPRHHHTCTASGRRLVVIGGRSGLDGRSRTHEVQAFDLESKKWILPPVSGPGPGPIDCHSATAIGGRIWVFGGRVGVGEDGGQRVNHVWTLDTDTWKWTAVQCKGQVPCPRSSHSAAAVGNTLYIFGGFDGTSTLSSMYALNTENLHWTIVEATGTITADGAWIATGVTPRYCASIAAMGPRLWLFGGDDRVSKSKKNDLMALSLVDLNWSQIQPAGEASAWPAPQYSHQMTLYVFGGKDKLCRQDIWALELPKPAEGAVLLQTPEMQASLHEELSRIMNVLQAGMVLDENASISPARPSSGLQGPPLAALCEELAPAAAKSDLGQLALDELMSQIESIPGNCHAAFIDLLRGFLVQPMLELQSDRAFLERELLAGDEGRQLLDLQRQVRMVQKELRAIEDAATGPSPPPSAGQHAGAREALQFDASWQLKKQAYDVVGERLPELGEELQATVSWWAEQPGLTDRIRGAVAAGQREMEEILRSLLEKQAKQALQCYDVHVQVSSAVVETLQREISANQRLLVFLNKQRVQKAQEADDAREMGLGGAQAQCEEDLRKIEESKAALEQRIGPSGYTCLTLFRLQILLKALSPLSLLPSKWQQLHLRIATFDPHLHLPHHLWLPALPPSPPH
eukprot:tig00000383_g24645.t1